MRISKFVRTLLGMASLFVTMVKFEGLCLIVGVKPTWRKPRCSKCKKVCAGYDHSDKPRRWIHLSFGALRTILEYTTRRVDCPTCGVIVELVPWARSDCRFTTPFEEMAAYLAQITNKTEVSRMLGISWRTVGNIIKRVVDDKLDPKRLEELRRIGIDEFGYRKRHRYVTVVVDHDTHEVVWADEGKSSDTLNSFFDDIGKEQADKLEVVTIDMSGGYIKSIEEKAPEAQIIFDRFHVQKLASDAVDEVRRDMVKELKEIDEPEAAVAIKKSRFILFKRPLDLTLNELGKLSAIEKYNTPLYRAYLLKEGLANVFEETSVDSAKKNLNRWLGWASRSRLAPFVKKARTIRKYKDRILAYIETRLTNGLSEGINNKLRMIARRAFGFHSADALIAMLFLCCGGIAVNPPLPVPWCTF